MSNCHICVLAASGSGHIRPTISLAAHLVRDPIITPHITLVIPVDSKCEDVCNQFKLVSIPRLKILPIHLGGPFADPNYMREYLDSRKEETASKLTSILHNPDIPPITAIVCDMFAVLWGGLLAQTLNVPHYVFFPSPLTFVWYSQRYREINSQRERKETHEHMKIPGISAEFNLTDFVDGPPSMMNRIYEYCDHFEFADGYICQDYLDLYLDKSTLTTQITAHFETARAKSGLKPNRIRMFTTGALCLQSFDSLKQLLPNPYRAETSIADWLDKQKARSTIFVALGSWCQIADSDVAELAQALDSSGRPFLWAYRPKKAEFLDATRGDSEVDSDADGLPKGFRQKFVNSDRGIICDWVDQLAVLQHPASACFVTHCGWNSLTEATALGGIPLLLLPIAAEQGVNSVVVEKEWQTGLRLWDMSPDRKLSRQAIVNKLNIVLEHPKFAINARICKEKLRAATFDTNGEAVRDRLSFFQHVLIN